MLLKFHSISCAPCKELSRWIKEQETSAQIQLDMESLDVGQPEAQAFMDEYNIRAVPALVNTVTGDVKIGFQPAQEYLRRYF